MWDHQKPRCFGEWMSSGRTENAWWWRWWAAHQIGPRCERLPQLDRGRADRLKGIGITRRLRHAHANMRQLDQPADGCGGVRVALKTAQRSMAGKDPAPAEQPQDMRGGPRHPIHPAGSAKKGINASQT